jgi:hypothetical protein
VELRASGQGLSDLIMGLAGAFAGAISGLIVDVWGYATLTLLAALATMPLIVLVSLSTSRSDNRADAVEAADRITSGRS